MIAGDGPYIRESVDLRDKLDALARRNKRIKMQMLSQTRDSAFTTT